MGYADQLFCLSVSVYGICRFFYRVQNLYYRYTKNRHIRSFFSKITSLASSLSLPFLIPSILKDWSFDISSNIFTKIESRKGLMNSSFLVFRLINPGFSSIEGCDTFNRDYFNFK